MTKRLPAMSAVLVFAGVILGSLPSVGLAQLRREVHVARPASQPDQQADQPDQPSQPVPPVVIRPAGPSTQPASQPPRIVRGPTTQPVAATRPDTTAKLPMPQRAFERLRLGWYAEGEKDLKSLLAGEQKLKASVALAELYRRTGRYDEAAKVLEDVASAGGKTGPWRCEKAELLATRGKYEEALALAQAALDDDPADMHARYLAGQQLETLGQIEKALAIYKPADEMTSTSQPDDAANRTYSGMVLDRYSRLISKPVAYGTRILHSHYQDTYEKIDRQYWPARVAAANLSLAAYKTQQAAEDFQAALKINPSAYEANMGLGWALLEMYQFEGVDQQVAAIRKVNPKDPGAYELEASLHMMERNYPGAEKSAADGLAVNPRHLGLLAVRAAAFERMNEKVKLAETIAAAEAINPRPGDFYHIMGNFQSAARQYDVAERYFKKAIELSPWDPNPRTSLGMMYMQTGQEKEASEVLEKAFAIDKYNVRSYNTLKLLDQLIAFDTIESEHFIIKFNRTSDAIIGGYFRDYLESIYSDLKTDYGLDLPRKVTVEVFPKHDEFSVRVSGRSWIPTVGACTGWVIAMYSPRDLKGQKNPQTGEPLGYNWARVLRHEFTHVVTLADTENRIPHWFTEGLAVSQEHNPPQWRWINMLTQALRTGQLFTVDKLDWGFIRPRRPTDREMAYAQSEWMVQYIVAEHGYGKINELLKAFREYKTQAQALKDVLGMTEAEFDRGFREWAAKYVVEEWKMSAEKIPSLPEAQKAVKDKPADAKAKALLAVAYLQGQPNAKEAEKAAREALELDPKQPIALEVMGVLLNNESNQLRRQSKFDEADQKWAAAKAFLVQLADVDGTNAAAPRLLGQHAVADKDYATAIFWFERLKAANPHDTLSYTGLAGIYLEQDNAEKAVVELAELARRQQSDPQYALKIAELYTEMGKPDQAIIWLDEAVKFDPFDPATHERLAKAYQALKNIDKTVTELKFAIQLKPDEETYWARLAYIYDDLGQKENARRAASFAVRIRPDSTAKDLLKKLSPSTQPE